MIDLNQIKNNHQQAIFLAKKQLPELVCDIVNLEGINYTIPEIQTLLDGVTVGGRKQQDELIANNQINAWKLLFDLLENNTFSFDKKTVCQLHHVLAQKEALNDGRFRNNHVFIAGTDYLPPPADQLDDIWRTSMPILTKTDNQSIYRYAISVFLQMARTQFFFDGNKRMGRLMMNGILLQHGLPIINLPAKKQLKFNQLMLDFYPSNNETPMQDFMLACLDKKIMDIMYVKSKKN